MQREDRQGEQPCAPCWWRWSLTSFCRGTWFSTSGYPITLLLAIGSRHQEQDNQVPRAQNEIQHESEHSFPNSKNVSCRHIQAQSVGSTQKRELGVAHITRLARADYTSAECFDPTGLLSAAGPHYLTCFVRSTIPAFVLFEYWSSHCPGCA